MTNIDSIYNDFTTKMLPKIQEGLVITKDYFADLFGRYVHYLFITDLIYTTIFFLLIVFIVWIAFRQKTRTWAFKREDYSDNSWVYIPIVISLLVFIGGFFFYLENTIKDKYIPEVRVFQELKGFNQK